MFSILAFFQSRCSKQMDEKLQQILKIRPLQASCIAYRCSTNEYRKMVRQACESELKNLVKVEMRIEQIKLKMPDESTIPNVSEEILASKADCLLKEISAVEKGLKYL